MIFKVYVISVGALAERFLLHDKKQMSVVMDEYEEFLLYPVTDFTPAPVPTDTATADNPPPVTLETFWKKVADKKVNNERVLIV